ncbi:MAG: ribosomal protein S18-alanine N-acetyltransferase [Lachnospiraceae bacterium]|nr:ribosomal protein S18-alanine N-acetyltransferase [Lachnospiraceae bacterium]
MEQTIREIKVRRMEVSDIGPLANIEKQCFSRPWSEREFGHLVEKTDALYLVADVTFESGMRKIVGTAGMRILGTEGDIDNVAVLPEFRNLGIAGKLLDGLLDMGRQKGVTEFTLEVRVSNEYAIKLYEKAGFVSEGIRPGFYEDPKEDANIMWIRSKQ